MPTGSEDVRLLGEDQKLSAHGQSDEIVRPWLRCGSSSGSRSGAPTSSSTRHSSMSPASCVRDTRAICSRRSQVICPSGGLSTGCPAPLQKYFASPVGQIISTNSRHPTPQEGRIMIVTNAGWDAVDAAAFCARWDCRAGRKTCERSPARGREMLQRTAKSCGPDAPTLASSLRSCVGPTGLRQNLIRRRRWQKSPVTGRARHKLLKPLRAGMPGDSGVLVVTRVRSTTTKCTRDRGCNGHPAFPTPSMGAEDKCTSSGASRRGVANVCLELRVI